MSTLRSGDRCPQTGVQIGVPEIDAQQRMLFFALNPHYRERELGFSGKEEG